MAKASAAKARLKLLRSGHDTGTAPVYPPVPGVHDLTTVLHRATAPFVHVELRDNKVDLGRVQEVLSSYLGSYTVADIYMVARG